MVKENKSLLAERMMKEAFANGLLNEDEEKVTKKVIFDHFNQHHTLQHNRL